MSTASKAVAGVALLVSGILALVAGDWTDGLQWLCLAFVVMALPDVS